VHSEKSTEPTYPKERRKVTFTVHHRCPETINERSGTGTHQDERYRTVEKGRVYQLDVIDGAIADPTGIAG
jgi:hypothetical protein